MKENWRISVGKTEADLRKKYTMEVSPLLKKWIKEIGNKKICPICGEDMPETFHVHHISGDHNDSSKNNKIYICASCHAITYKAKKDLKKLWKERHDKMLSKRKDVEDE